MHSLINVSENITYPITFFVNQATNLKLLKSPWKLGFKGALHSYLFLTFNCGSFCEHLLFVFEFKTITVKVCKSYHIFFGGFQIFTKIKNVLGQSFAILSIHKSFLGSCLLPQKCWALSVQPC